MKTAISVPDEIFEEAEDLTKRLGLSRSELFSRAVKSYVKSHRREGITEKLNEIYSREDSSLEPILHDLQFHSVVSEKW